MRRRDGFHQPFFFFFFSPPPSPKQVDRVECPPPPRWTGSPKRGNVCSPPSLPLLSFFLIARQLARVDRDRMHCSGTKKSETFFLLLPPPREQPVMGQLVLDRS